MLFSIQRLWCTKARQVLRDLFSTNQLNLWQKFLKLTSEIWKPRYNWRFTWACILKASKSSLQIFLTHFMPLIYFDTPWKHQKTYGFLMFSGVSKEISGTKWVSIYDDIVVPIAVLLPIQQFYITKMMMLIFSITVVSVCLFSVSGLLSFQGILFSGCYQISHMRYRKQYVGI